MKGTNLGELEEMILLVVAALYDDAYGVSIQDEIKKRCKRSISISTVHKVLTRLEDKGFLSSRYAGASAERGGRRKHLFNVTKAGEAALVNLRTMREQLWSSINKIAFEQR